MIVPQKFFLRDARLSKKWVSRQSPRDTPSIQVDNHEKCYKYVIVPSKIFFVTLASKRGGSTVAPWHSPLFKLIITKKMLYVIVPLKNFSRRSPLKKWVSTVAPWHSPLFKLIIITKNVINVIVPKKFFSVTLSASQKWVSRQSPVTLASIQVDNHEKCYKYVIVPSKKKFSPWRSPLKNWVSSTVAPWHSPLFKLIITRKNVIKYVIVPSKKFFFDAHTLKNGVDSPDRSPVTLASIQVDNLRKNVISVIVPSKNFFSGRSLQSGSRQSPMTSLLFKLIITKNVISGMWS